MIHSSPLHRFFRRMSRPALGLLGLASLLSFPARAETILTVTQYGYDTVGRQECTAQRMNLSSIPADGTRGGNACTLSTTGGNGPDRITRSVYDAAGELVQVRKAVGTGIENAYVTYGWLNPATGQIESRYGDNGKYEYVVDANGNKAKLVYDGFGRQTQWIFPSLTRPSTFNAATRYTALSSAGALSTDDSSPDDYEQYAYDLDNNRTGLRKRDGSSISYHYDGLNRLTYKDLPGLSSVYYGYDLQGRQLYARFGGPTGVGVTNVYDALGRLTSSSNNVSGTNRTLSYQYDAHDNRARLTFPDTQYVTYGYDYVDRMIGIFENGSTQIATIAYDNQGQRSGLSGGVTTAYSRDGIGRLTSLSHDFSGTGQDVTYSLTGYNPASQLLGQTISNDGYVYPDFKNANSSYAANGLNQYTAVGPKGFCYDANANLTGDGTYAYKYDVENRLIERHLTPGGSCPVSYSGTTNVTLSYDPNGRLAQTVAGAAATQFLYDGDDLVAEYDGAGSLLRRYVHGPEVDDPLFWYEGSNLADRRPLRSDHLGSIVNVANSSGSTISILTYDEYGFPGSSNLGRFQYTGQIMIPEAGLYYYKARMYAPKLGRFMQTDPIGYKDQINLYAYVGNDPIDAKDPSGLSGLSDAWASFVKWWNTPVPGTRHYEPSEMELVRPEMAWCTCDAGVLTDQPETRGEITLQAVELLGTVAPGFGKGAARGLSAEAKFAQKTFSSTFSAEGKFAGRSVKDVASALRAGSMKPSDIPVGYIVRDGKSYILNTRSAQALESAGIPRAKWKAVNQTGKQPYEDLLTGQLRRNPGAPFDRVRGAGE